MMISVVIPTKDRNEVLQKTIELAKAAINPFVGEIIVVNDSKDKIVIPEVILKGITLVDNPKDGVASARNFGASKARGEWLLFMDDDMLIHSSNIKEVMLLVKKYPKACFNINWEYPDDLKRNLRQTQFGRFLNYYGFTNYKGWNKNAVWSDDSVFETQTITSQFFFIRKEDFFHIGGYNEHFPHAGFEDYDLTKRIHQNNIKIYVQPKSFAYHNEVDRMNILQWLARRKRGGKTRKVAVKMGYEELNLHYQKFKSSLFEFVIWKKQYFLKILQWIPNRIIFDRIYFFAINLLYAASVYEGYQEKE